MKFRVSYETEHGYKITIEATDPANFFHGVPDYSDPAEVLAFIKKEIEIFGDFQEMTLMDGLVEGSVVVERIP